MKKGIDVNEILKKWRIYSEIRTENYNKWKA